jgi:hypothetical protein
MSENEISPDYIKGFIDALEFVVKSFRGIQINNLETKPRNVLMEERGISDLVTNHSASLLNSAETLKSIPLKDGKVQDKIPDNASEINDLINKDYG